MTKSASELSGVDWQRYDFIDLGASNGGSLRACAHYFDVERGIGIDLDRNKVQQTRESGFDVVEADALALDVDDAVRFVSAIDFLEHLPSLDAVEKMLERAARAATDFIYISHPSFEAEHYLRAVGLTQYWHAWTGHRAHIQISDYCCMFQRLGLQSYSIQYIGAITSSEHPSIIPVGRMNTGPYDPDTHGQKASHPLEKGVWRSQRLFVALRRFEPSEWREITSAWPIRDS